MLCDLVSQKIVHRFERAAVFRLDAHGASERQIFVTIRNISLD